MKKETKIKRITIDVTDSYHRDIKQRATMRGISIKEYVHLSLDNYLLWEKTHDKKDK